MQLTETDLASEAEIKNMAVLASHRHRGIGRALVAAAIGLARDESRSTLLVATAAADVESLLLPTSGIPDALDREGRLHGRNWL